MDESIEVTSLGNMLSICLFFGEFELGYAYKLYAYKKKCNKFGQLQVIIGRYSGKIGQILSKISQSYPQMAKNGTTVTYLLSRYL